MISQIYLTTELLEVGRAELLEGISKSHFNISDSF